ncbi:MAG: hypothetical protein B7Z68_02755 [Acidobacteria bacterium 21-70-11]|nr:MAG: hypothetical protein B7Z68_02755 [Acidobacteria bacterium 21-70-11]
MASRPAFDAAATQREFMANLYVRRGLTLVRGEGVELVSDTGERYLDLASNYGVNILGYSHPGLEAALIAQLRALPTLHCSFASDVRAQASAELARRVNPADPGLVYWCNSGAEAVEAALKFAAMATGKRRFVACRGAYHGKTLGALSATWGAKYREPFEPLLWEFAHVEYGDPAALEAVAADIVCLGKGLAGGIPVGATVVTRAVGERLERGAHSSTFGGNPLALAGVRFILATLDAAVLEHVAATGEAFLAALRSVAHDLVAGARGRGLMLGLVVSDRRDDILRGLQKRKVLAVPAGSHVVRFLPPYTIESSHIERAVAALGGALRGM